MASELLQSSEIIWKKFLSIRSCNWLRPYVCRFTICDLLLPLWRLLHQEFRHLMPPYTRAAAFVAFIRTATKVMINLFYFGQSISDTGAAKKQFRD